MGKRNIMVGVDLVISVTDRYLPYPPRKRVVWAPWVEGKILPFEVLQVALCALRDGVRDPKTKRIYLHCDAGTNRAPSTFGLFLETFYPKLAQDVVGTRKFLGGVSERYFSDPLYYSRCCHQDDPNLQLFLDWLKRDQGQPEEHQALERFLGDLVEDPENLAQGDDWGRFHSNRFKK